MPHVIEPIYNKNIDDALADLYKAHEFLVCRAKDKILAFSGAEMNAWGIDSKRITVDLRCNTRPSLIGKEEEKLFEVVNIAATVERLIAAIEWFKSNYHLLKIRECHPSTSDEVDENDLVLQDENGVIVARCEVCDVVSDNANSNNKERKELRNLGCADLVPPDEIKRYICTAPEFAIALTRKRRIWATKHYKYEQFLVGDASDTRLLLINPGN